MFGGHDFWLETRVITLDMQEPLTDFHGNEAKKNQNGQLKKTEIFKIANSLRFSKLPILENFSRKFHGLVLGLVVLIDAKMWH